MKKSLVVMLVAVRVQQPYKRNTEIFSQIITHYRDISSIFEGKKNIYKLRDKMRWTNYIFSRSNQLFECYTHSSLNRHLQKASLLHRPSPEQQNL